MGAVGGQDAAQTPSSCVGWLLRRPRGLGGKGLPFAEQEGPRSPHAEGVRGSFPGQEVGRGSGLSLLPRGPRRGQWTVPGERWGSAGDPGLEPLTAQLRGFSGQAAHRQACLPGGEQLRSQ